MNEQKNTKYSVLEYVIIAIICISIVAMFFSFQKREFSFSAYESSNLEYVRAEVLEVLESETSDERGYTTGYQKLKVEILEGKAKGRIVEIENYITVVHNVELKKGSSFIVCADVPEGIEPMFSVYNYNRTPALLVIMLLFVGTVTLIGRKKGLLSCLGLLFTLCTVVCCLIPSLFEGGNTFWSTFLAMLASTAVSCFCIGGISRKTLNNIYCTLLGVGAACLIYFIFTLILNITCSGLEEAEMLSLISNVTGLDITGILFAGVAVSTLGAVMDVAVSMGASLHEIRTVDPSITPRDLFVSGMNIGRDMIGTMTNTLILAFAGGTLATLMVLVSYGVQFNQLMSSDFIAMEMAAGFAGSIGIVLTVPISAFVGSYIMKPKKKNANRRKKHER